MKTTTTILICLVFQLLCSGQDYDELAKKFHDEHPPGSIFKARIIADELRQKTTDEVLIELDSDVSIKEQSDALRAIADTYSRALMHSTITSDLLRSKAEVMKYSIPLAIRSGSNPITSLVTEGVASVNRKGLDYIQEEVGRATHGAATKVVQKALAKYESIKGGDALRQLAEIESTDDKGKAIILVEKLITENFLDELEIESIPGLDHDGKEVIKGALAMGLGDMGASVLQDLADHGSRLSSIASEVGILQRGSQAIWDAAADLNGHLSNVSEHMDKVNSLIGLINGRVAEKGGPGAQGQARNIRDLNYVQGFLLGNVAPEETLEGLKGAFFPGMGKGDSLALEQKIEIEESSKSVLEGMSEYLNTANEVLKVASLLGVDDDLISDVSEVIDGGTKVVEGAMAFASGNYMAAIGSFTSVLGIGGKSDPEAARHKQIVGMLKNVLSNQRAMMAKLDRIEQRQLELLRGQVAILTKLDEIHKDLQRNHQVVMKELDELGIDVLINREGIRELLEQGYEKCPDLKRSGIDTGFVDYEARSKHYRDFNGEFQSCRQYLEDAIRIGGGSSQSHARFTGDFDPGITTAKKEYHHFRAYWKKMMQILEYVIEEEDLDFAKVFNSAVSPVNNATLLDTIVTYMEDVRLPEYMVFLSDLLTPRLVERYYSKDRTLVFMEYFLRTLPYEELTEDIGDEELLTFSKLFQGEGLEVSTKLNIKHVLLRLDILLFQQALMSGATVIPYFYDLFKKGSDAAPEMKDTFMSILASNSRLASNFTKYALYRELKNAGKEPLNYHWAITLKKNRHLLDKFVQEDSNWSLVTCDKNKAEESMRVDNGVRWCMQFAYGKNKPIIVQLPSMEELGRGEMEFSFEFYEALRIKKTLLEYLYGEEYLSDVSPEDRAILAISMLTNN